MQLQQGWEGGKSKTMPGMGKGRGAAARNNLKGHALEGIAHSSCIGTWRQAEHFIG